MNIYQDLEDSLYNIIEGLHPEWTVLFAFSNASEPLNPYLAIDVRKITQTGSEYSSTPTVGADGTKLIQTTYQDYVAGVRFEFIGKYDDQTSVADMAHSLQLELRTDGGYDLQRANRLSLFNLTSLRRLPLRRETEMYMIYQLDVDFAYTGMATTEQDYTTGIEGGGVYHDANRPPDYVLKTEFEINYP